MRIILALVLLLAGQQTSAPTNAIQWAKASKSPTTIIVSFDPEKCGFGGTDETCVYVNVWLKGGGVVVVNRHSGATKRCEGDYTTDVSACRP